MTLYELSEAFNNIVCIDDQAIDSTTGEVLDIEYLEQLEMDRAEKIENCIKFYKNKMSDSESLKKEAQRLQKLAKTAENLAEQTKKYLSFLS